MRGLASMRLLQSLIRNDGRRGSATAPTTIRHCEAVSLFQTAEAILIGIPSNTAAIISSSVNEIASVVPTGSGLLRNDGRAGSLALPDCRGNPNQYTVKHRSHHFMKRQ